LLFLLTKGTQQEKGHFSLTLAPLFLKDLENPQFSNSGAKVEIMWGYENGVKISGAKVEFVKDVDFGVKLLCGIPWCMVQTPKSNPRWIEIFWCKTPKLTLNGMRICGVKHQN